MTVHSADPKIESYTHYYAPAGGPGTPAFVVQVTALIDSYMIWVGTCEEIPGAESETPESSAPGRPQGIARSRLEDDVENTDVSTSDSDRRPGAPHPRVVVAIRQGRLAKDWACAMPTINPSIPNPSTSLFRSGESDVSLTMAQRLARRWKKQIFLAVDLPPKFEQTPQIALEAEKRVLESLKRVEGQS
ncbi:hypothetical protein FRB99_006313 [Tulasnella sp. 403]|nr:hypothetical protein FRB99_006313 [Tulasnella sp. 403]